MSLRIVRSLTPSRSASSGPGQSGRACRSDNNASIRAEVPCTKRKLSFLIAFYCPFMTQDIRPFRVEIPQADLDDLADRLARTRLPRPAPADDWDYGVPNHYLAEMVAHWRTAFVLREVAAAGWSVHARITVLAPAAEVLARINPTVSPRGPG